MRGERTEQMRELMRNDNRLNLHFHSPYLTSFEQWHHRFIRIITDVSTNGSVTNMALSSQHCLHYFTVGRGWLVHSSWSWMVGLTWKPLRTQSLFWMKSCSFVWAHSTEKSHFLLTCALLAFWRCSVQHSTWSWAQIISDAGICHLQLPACMVFFFFNGLQPFFSAAWGGEGACPSVASNLSGTLCQSTNNLISPFYASSHSKPREGLFLFQTKCYEQ